MQSLPITTNKCEFDSCLWQGLLLWQLYMRFNRTVVFSWYSS